MGRTKSKTPATKEQPDPRTMDAYRKKWAWDDVAWATHCVDCYPGSCMYHIYLTEGKVADESCGRDDPLGSTNAQRRDPYRLPFGNAKSYIDMVPATDHNGVHPGVDVSRLLIQHK